MYIPKNFDNNLVYHYDVNSLYPHVMKTCKYPTKYFAHFHGDITKMNEYVKLFNDFVSFLRVRVKAPSITHPLLPFKLNNTTIYAEGTWEGWYYSEELLNYAKYGYTFEIIEGYLFESSSF